MEGLHVGEFCTEREGRLFPGMVTEGNVFVGPTWKPKKGMRVRGYGFFVFKYKERKEEKKNVEDDEA